MLVAVACSGEVSHHRDFMESAVGVKLEMVYAEIDRRVDAILGRLKHFPESLFILAKRCLNAPSEARHYTSPMPLSLRWVHREIGAVAARGVSLRRSRRSGSPGLRPDLQCGLLEQGKSEPLEREFEQLHIIFAN